MGSLLPIESVQKKIIVIRGRKVMLDRDLPDLYNVETRVLKQAVRRNRERFPDDFMFELNEDEEKCLRSQTVILKGGGRHSKYTSFASTEQGIAMLSSVLNSKQAIETNDAYFPAIWN